MGCSPTGSSVHGILQARILEWVAILFSPGDLSNPGIKPRSPVLQADSLLSEPPGKPTHMCIYIYIYIFLKQKYQEAKHLSYVIYSDIFYSISLFSNADTPT